MNTALIFAGGTGQRMNSRTLPKQFLELHGKPIIIHTLEHFEKHQDIDAIVVVCLETWIEHLKCLLKKFSIEKVVEIVPGGANGQESIFHGLRALHDRYPDDTVVLIHDGVRPLIDRETISLNIESVLKNGNAITVSHVVETVAVGNEDGTLGDIFDRSKVVFAKAPQSFYLGHIFEAHMKAIEEGLKEFIDSASMMRHYGYPLYMVEGSPENIKITTPNDFYIFRAIVDARENSQIFG
ncbi:2-C-methyl-D-erythritol 4-phosphate cytidylyltransferase [Gehongia tenuis]|uniref:Ribitol-5-phosphate cytidylyltransferase n=1 Tax=Gehongia tenuis TaxID=2763655 RepID=A0A926D6W7_9FIRM|nr:2-C-methyl-D-erythritol 4-phosphate cytidylyltransferase [Gehongia tenuis]MBC8532361.1 2-C-methyl-D-erythritol 4-phosphate cytidylyltransferase [Gehongia tenuis]